jgi:hypothetical protein
MYAAGVVGDEVLEPPALLAVGAAVKRCADVGAPVPRFVVEGLERLLVERPIHRFELYGALSSLGEIMAARLLASTPPKGFSDADA